MCCTGAGARGQVWSAGGARATGRARVGRAGGAAAAAAQPVGARQAARARPRHSAAGAQLALAPQLHTRNFTVSYEYNYFLIYMRDAVWMRGIDDPASLCSLRPSVPRAGTRPGTEHRTQRDLQPRQPHSRAPEKVLMQLNCMIFTTSFSQSHDLIYNSTLYITFTYGYIAGSRSSRPTPRSKCQSQVSGT